MITTHVPTNWHELQQNVAQILEECGFSVEVEKKTQTPRGTVEIDVYAQERLNSRSYTVLCECKNWSSRVPQTVVHSFRTVVMESGANLGYIISSAGFQSGAFSAAELTNLRLLTWEQFQLEFEQDWLEKYFMPKVYEALDPFTDLVEPLLPKAYYSLDDEGRQRFMVAWRKYQPLNVLVMPLMPFMREIMPDATIPTLPLKKNWRDELAVDIAADVLNATAYRELLHALIAFGKIATAELEEALHPS